jgi:hypothetical protein
MDGNRFLNAYNIKKVMTDYSTTGIVTSFSSNTDGTLVEILPTGSGIFVAASDANTCFYCYRGGEARLNKYLSDLNSDGAWCSFHNDIQLAQQQYVANQITVNNTDYVQTYVTNIISPPAGTTPSIGSPAAVLATLQSNVASLLESSTTNSTAVLALQTWASTLSADETTDMESISTNSSAIVALQNQVASLLSAINQLTILNISNGSFKTLF